MQYSKDLNRFSLINRRNLRAREYTQSLIAEALRVDLLSMQEVDDLQMQIMGQLETAIKRASLRDCAVDEAVGRELLAGVYFTVDTNLLSFHDPMYALSVLQSESISTIFENGRQQLRAHYLQTVDLYVRARSIRLPCENALYEKTVGEEMQEALLLWDPLFPARTPARFSYPLGDRRAERHGGIFYPKAYLEALMTEHRFYALFDPIELDVWLTESPPAEGVFRAVLGAALSAVMLGRFSGTLYLTEDEKEALCGRLERRTSREITDAAILAANTLIRDLLPGDPLLQRSVRRGAVEWAKEISAQKIRGTLRAGLLGYDPAPDGIEPDGRDTITIQGKE